MSTHLPPAPIPRAVQRNGCSVAERKSDLGALQKREAERSGMSRIPLIRVNELSGTRDHSGFVSS